MGDANLMRSRDLGEHFECKLLNISIYLIIFAVTAFETLSNAAKGNDGLRIVLKIFGQVSTHE